jgi:hypothetical protein
MSYIANPIRRCLLLAILAAGGLLSVGCAKDVPVTHYPTFYSDSIKTLGVVRFRNRSGNARAGLLMAEAFTRALEANGTYRVLGPGQVDRLPADANATADPDRPLDEWVSDINNAGEVDAVVTGVVLAYQAGQYSVPDSTVSVGTGVGYGRPYPYRHWSGGLYGYRSWPVTYRMEREAAVSVKITLTRSSDGQVLFTTAQPVRMRLDSRDVEGDVPAEEMLGHAADRAASMLADRVAPHRITLKLKPDKTLRTARDFSAGEYDYADEFHPGQTLYAVLSLPDEADRNTFRLAIIPKEGAAEIASREIVWTRSAEKRSVTFEVDELLKDAGPGEYLLKLYSGDVFAFQQDFRVRPKK